MGSLNIIFLYGALLRIATDLSFLDYSVFSCFFCSSVTFCESS